MNPKQARALGSQGFERASRRGFSLAPRHHFLSIFLIFLDAAPLVSLAFFLVVMRIVSQNVLWQKRSFTRIEYLRPVHTVTPYPTSELFTRESRVPYTRRTRRALCETVSQGCREGKKGRKYKQVLVGRFRRGSRGRGKTFSFSFFPVVLYGQIVTWGMLQRISQTHRKVTHRTSISLRVIIS